MTVDVVHFNPLRRREGILSRFSPPRPLNNFGDLLGPLLVERIVEFEGLRPPHVARRLVTIGSIMKMTIPGDVVWGTGVNGKSMEAGAAPHLDVRAVRGPRTRELLMAAGTTVPAVYGDPALLWPRFWPREHYLTPGSTRTGVAVVPNFHDRRQSFGGHVIDPIGDPHDIIGEIARSDFVCGSSLHGIIIAESFGIPARLISPGTEPDFKYDDYYSGTGRPHHTPASSVAEAVEMGGEVAPVFDADALLDAFPRDLWGRSPEL